MQVREQGLVRAEAAELLGHRLLHLQQQVTGRPHLVGGVGHARARGDVILVRHRRTDARALLHDHLVTARDQGGDAVRADGDAVLAGFQFARDSDAHGRASWRGIGVPFIFAWPTCFPVLRRGRSNRVCGVGGRWRWTRG